MGVQIIEIKEGKKCPDGIPIESNTQHCILSHDFSQLSFSNNLNFISYDITGFQLNPEKDKLIYASKLSVDYIFAYSHRDQIPTGFIYSLVPKKENHPQILSFALDSILFHRQILAAFVPCPDIFVIVSREGMTVHNKRFQTLFTLPLQISYCCTNLNYVLLGQTNFKQILYKFVEGEIPMEIKRQENVDQCEICQIISLSHSILLIFQDGNRMACIRKISLSSHETKNLITFQPYFNSNALLSKLKFFPYDDALLVVDTNNHAILMDLMDSYPIIIGEIFTFSSNINKIYGSSDLENCQIMPNYSQFYKYCTDGKQCYEIKPYLTRIQEDTNSLIAAILRRSTGLSPAMALFSKHLKSIQSVQKMEELVDAVGPSAISPIAQIRFSRALQFSGIPNIHLILLGLIEFSIILGDQLIIEAQMPLIETITHPSCKHTFQNLLSCWKLKLNPSTIKAIYLKNDLSFRINPKFVSDPLMFASICIDCGRKDEAKTLLLRCNIEGKFDKDKIIEIQEKFNCQFS